MAYNLKFEKKGVLAKLTAKAGVTEAVVSS